MHSSCPHDSCFLNVLTYFTSFTFAIRSWWQARARPSARQDSEMAKKQRRIEELQQTASVIFGAQHSSRRAKREELKTRLNVARIAELKQDIVRLDRTDELVDQDLLALMIIRPCAFCCSVFFFSPPYFSFPLPIPVSTQRCASRRSFHCAPFIDCAFQSPAAALGLVFG